MKYRLFDSVGEPAGEGDLSKPGVIEAPDGGVVAIEMGEGWWLSFSVSEWGHVSMTQKPDPTWQEVEEIEKT